MRILRESETFSPYRAALGPAFAFLHPHVRRAHQAPLVGEGSLDVEHGRHWLTPLLVRLMSLPAAGRGQPVRLEVAAVGTQLEWVRRIGSSVLRTRQEALGPRLIERHRLGRVMFALVVDGGALVYRQISVGVAGLPLPPFASPRVEARVSPEPDGWHVDVLVTWRTHLICRYAGSLRLS